MNFLVFSAHDFRSKRKAGIHFVAAELSNLGQTRFFSSQFSFLSQLKGDPRSSLNGLANRVTHYNGVDCYLWKTFIHPINLRNKFLNFLEEFLFYCYLSRIPNLLIQWIKEADTVIFESGIAPIFFEVVRAINPTAKTIYIASDDLATINVASYVLRIFGQVAPKMSAICLKSKYMSDKMPLSLNKYIIPHGFDFSIAEHADPSPYPDGIHAVAIGSMLFDSDFFVHASKQFPEITFHIIGSGSKRLRAYGPNVRLYDEMPFTGTLPYVKHAAIGIAPYRNSSGLKYLSDTSLKLMQYDFFGLPAVCPNVVANDVPSRYGYEPGNENSIKNAINKALTAPRKSFGTPLRWDEVVARILSPSQFIDTNFIAD